MKLTNIKTLELLENASGASKYDNWIEHSIWVGNPASVIVQTLKLKKYYDSIEQSHINGNVNVVIDFMLMCINSSLEKITQKIKLNNNQLKIIDLIKENPKITRNELADIKYNLKKLVDNEIIERIGSDNGVYWKVK